MVDYDRVEIPQDIAALARELNFDPWQAISEGTLLAAVDPRHVQDVQRVWNALGIESFVLGRFDAELKENTVRRNKTVQPLVEPEADPFWELFFEGLP